MSGLNTEDFNRLQVQLLELREVNCYLKETELKQKKELLDTHAKLKSYKEENTRLTNSLRSSKKAQEVDFIYRENDNLRARLRDQEEDFRLQNNTLLQELSKLVQENEGLNKKVNLNEKCTELSDSDDSNCCDEDKKLIKLQKELSILEKRLKDNNTEWVNEKVKLKETTHKLAHRVIYLQNIIKKNGYPAEEFIVSLADEKVKFKKESIETDEFNDISQERQLAALLQQIEDISLLKNQNETDSRLQVENKVIAEEEQNTCKQQEIKISELENTVTELKHSIEDQESKISKLNIEKRRLQDSVNDYQTKVQAMVTNSAALEDKLSEATKISSDRKNVIEEMKACMETDSENHTKELEKQESAHKNEVTILETFVSDLKQKNEELSKLEPELKERNQEITELSYINAKLKDDYEEIQTVLNITTEELSKVQTSFEQEKEKCLQEQSQAHETEKKELLTQIEIGVIVKQELEEKINALERQIADGEEEKKIHERKGLTLMKDLKKQLSSERKRADRLQEKLGQLIDISHSSSFSNNVAEKSDDVSSVSSWSMISGEQKDTSFSSDTGIVVVNNTNPLSSEEVSEETASLVERVTELQEEKWKLEEMIAHLESSSASMAEDLLKKSALIQHYCIENHVQDTQPSSSTSSSSSAAFSVTDKINVKRVLDALQNIGKGDENSKEINRRLHRLLEETLAKNMHLHKDVENLTRQVQDLTKLAVIKAQSTDDSMVELEMDVTDGLVN